MTTTLTRDGRKLWELSNGEWVVSFCEASQGKINVMSECPKTQAYRLPRFLSREDARRIWKEHLARGYMPR